MTLRYRNQKRRVWEPKAGYACKYCGSNDHYSFACFNKPKPPLKKESTKTKAKRLLVSKEWFRLNPSDKKGTWKCYLQISPDCPKRVTRSTINLEHVKPRTRNPELKFQVSNIRAACQPCNKLKGAWTLEQLAETYPQIKKLLEKESI